MNEILKIGFDHYKFDERTIEPYFAQGKFKIGLKALF